MDTENNKEHKQRAAKINRLSAKYSKDDFLNMPREIQKNLAEKY